METDTKRSFEIQHIGDSYELLINGIKVTEITQSELNLIARVFDMCRTDKTENYEKRNQ